MMTCYVFTLAVNLSESGIPVFIAKTIFDFEPGRPVTTGIL